MRPRFGFAAAIVAVMAVMLVAAPVAAATQWTTYRQVGTQAFAGNGVCTDRRRTTTCSGENLSVFVGQIRQSGFPTRKGEQTCYERYSQTFTRATFETIEAHGMFGCTFNAGTLTINDLTSATLTPTVINLTAYQCDASTCTETPAGSITMRGTWAGVGPVVTVKSHSKFGDGSCMQVNVDNGSFRQASFEGTVAAPDAQMGQGSFTFRTNCMF
jgi:hypothetical protein